LPRWAGAPEQDEAARKAAIAVGTPAVSLSGCAQVDGEGDATRPDATGPGAAEINCANDPRLQRANARIHRVERAAGERVTAFSAAPGARTFVCFTDRSGRVVNVTEQLRNVR